MAANNPVDVLRRRGFVQDVTDEEGLRAAFDAGSVTFYYGMDPTAPSLHLGNLIGLMAMAWLQRMGHRPIALAGGGTGRIGDPSGRDDERQLLDEEALEHNLAGIRRQASQFIDLEQGGLLVDNHDWLGQLSLMDFLRDVGKHASVNQMVARESVKRRLEERDQGISFTEFTYQLLQAYDFAHLHEAEGCTLQLGGSDQWGNIVAGTEMVRRLHGAQAFGLTWPLLTTASGAKFGKSAGNAVWLDAALTSPYAYYQYWINAADEDVERYLLLFTFLSPSEIDDVLAAHAEAPHQRAAQRLLASEATRIVHGDDGVEEAIRATDVLFGNEPFTGLSDGVLREAFEGADSFELPADARTSGAVSVLEVLTTSGAAASGSEARRLVEQGGVRMNNVRVTDALRALSEEDFATEHTLVLRVGKKRYFVGRVS
ncbi:tyrosine--tRNA ligase [Euzebya tangerina]|uniref:tyrosine--tRNA ligase n=1 Tax=Euzebya tangerina TaxID=591198 RepID=UPI000E310ED0|nr:tyrosine--tRNA ligase [Euzebya tangerina]